MKRLAIILFLTLIATSLSADPLTEARAANNRLRKAINSRDAALITRMYGPTGFRTADTNRILWDWLEDLLKSGDAITNAPVRVLAATKQIAIIGWERDTLEAARYVWDENTQAWLLVKALEFTQAQQPADRAAFEKYLKTIPDTRLADALFFGRTTASAIGTDIAKHRTPAPPPPKSDIHWSPATSTDDLLLLYGRIAHYRECSVINILYTPTAHVTDPFGTYDRAALLKQCETSEKRPNCSMRNAETNGNTVHATEVCVHADFAGSLPITITFARQANGTLLITDQRNGTN